MLSNPDIGMTPARSWCRSKLTDKTNQRDEGVRPPSCHLAQHSGNRASTLISLLENCGRPAATIPASTWSPSHWPDASVAGRVMARCHAAQPPPSPPLRQGCDQKHRPGSLGAGAPGSTPGDAINPKEQQPMTGGLFVMSVLLFVAGVTLISLG